MNTAIGVLKFLASQNAFSEERGKRFVALCDQVKMAVRFDLDPHVRDSLNSVTKELDAILAVSPGSGEKKPDAGA